MSANRAAARPRLDSDSDSDADTSPQTRSRGKQLLPETRKGSSFFASTPAFSSSVPRMATAEEIAGGAGAFIEEQDSTFVILGLAPGGPAAQSAKIFVGDELVGIDRFKTR